MFLKPNSEELAVRANGDMFLFEAAESLRKVRTAFEGLVTKSEDQKSKGASQLGNRHWKIDNSLTLAGGTT